MDNGVKVLTQVYQTTDGKIWSTREEADNHQDVVMKQQAINRLKDYAKYKGHNMCASGIEEALERCGFVYDPLRDKLKGAQYEKVKQSLRYTGY